MGSAAIKPARIGSRLGAENVYGNLPVYQFAVDRLGAPAARIGFVSANGWDAWAGAAFGFQSIWINRNATPPERLHGTSVATVRGAGELPALLGV